MKILVTGSNGFIGKHLCNKLKLLNYNIIETGSSSLHNLKDQSIANFLIKHYKPNVVIHLAAKVGGIGANKENPGRFMRDNLTMGINIINASLDNQVDKFIMTGTVCSYPKYTQVPFRESDIWNGYPEETNAPYGIAKKTLMELIISYNKQFGFNGINLIPVNMYGPGDVFDPTKSHVIPALILKVYKAIINNEDIITVWGSGLASREFLYVDDFVNAVILALKKDDVSPYPINIGTGREVTIAKLIEIICVKMNYNGRIIYDTSKPDGQPRRCLDINKAQQILKYNPTIDLNSGLDTTIKWFFENRDKMNDYLDYI
jgi:GDP-L-fucose synthase